MKKTLLVILLAIVSVATLSAQTTRERIMADPSLAAGVYRPYPTPTVAQTPAPKGYEPFYISHYGRHGSRYEAEAEQTGDLLGIFRTAEKLGLLTAKGKDLALFDGKANVIERHDTGKLFGYSYHFNYVFPSHNHSRFP